jgi:dGTPase
VCHDFEDAVSAGIVTAEMLPGNVRSRCGDRRSEQLRAFVHAMIDAAARTGRIGMDVATGRALSEFRRFNYEQVYQRPASAAQGRAVISLLQALVEHYADRPNLIPDGAEAVVAGSDEALQRAVAYVAGMTDRFACRQGVALLGWDRAKLPRGIDVLA